MTREKLLSVLDIAEELNTGKATTKFMLKRFKKWLPYDFIDGQAFYHPDKTIKLLFIIQENLAMGILPSKIETKLNGLCDGNSDDLLNHFSSPSKNKDTHLSNDGLTLLESLITDIGEQQKRIAIAHEKRADIEGKKAVAIEKRAEAEEKKAEAMNNIAVALQEMNKLRAIDPATRQIAHQAASIIVTDETDTRSPEDSSTELDNLSLLLDETEESGDTPETQIDDLSKLIDDAPLVSSESEQLDDLSALIEQTDNEPATEPVIELDDLSKLIDDSTDSGQEAQDLNDLSLLITDDSLQMDDLSKLIDDPKTMERASLGEDDLKDTPAIKIDVSPEEDVEKYKAAIMKIIIELKTDGLGVEETTDRLNKDKIKTLSGKPEWGQKAISQIYKFIESAK